MTEAIIGWGTLFQTGDGGSPVIWSTLAEVTSFSPPGPSRDSIDTSHENGPNEWRESLPGLKSPGEMKMDINFVPGGDACNDLLAELNDQIIRQRRLVFPNGAILGFSAFLTGLEFEAPIDDRLKASVTFQVSGQMDPFT